MALPHNYLMVAPSDLTDTFGTALHSSDLIKGLQMCNSNLCIPDPAVFPWYPRQKEGGTTLWLGSPAAPTSKKITTFRLGLIPEFSQIGPTGLVEVRGWRSVLQRVIASRSASRAKVERIFKVNLSTTGKPDGTCPQCRKEGKGPIPSKAASGYCDTHDLLLKQIARNQRTAKDAPLAWADQSAFKARQPVSVNLRGKK